MIYLSVIQTLTLLALAYVVRTARGSLRDVLNQSATDRQAAADALNAAHGAHRKEVQTLLQRIQAPQVAVIEHAQQPTEPFPPVNPLTDEQAAIAENATLQADRALQEMEQRENDLHGLVAR